MRILCFLVFAFALMSSANTSIAQNAEPDLEEMAKKSANPISDIWLLFVQNDTTTLAGDAVSGAQVMNVTKIQPVMSVPLFEDRWNLVMRPVVQLVSSPFDSNVGDLIGKEPNDLVTDPDLLGIASSPFGRTHGLGDTVLLTLAGPNTDDGWIYAGGVSQIFPTATEEILGQGKYQAGPAALLARIGSDHGGFGIEHFNFGFLAQQWWSIGGPNGRDNTNHMDIQYFLNWKATPTRLIGMGPNISINWEADGGFNDKVAFPIGLGVTDMIKLGPLPIRVGLEAQYYLTGPKGIGREANFRLGIAPIIPNPLKR